MGRKIARESAMKLLYQMNVNKDNSEEAISMYLENSEFTEGEQGYIKDTLHSIFNNLEDIDAYIEKHSKGWKLNRLSKVDLAILRIAVDEMLFREDIPIQVSINEAIEIGKKYSSAEASKFINGLLGSLSRELEMNG